VGGSFGGGLGGGVGGAGWVGGATTGFFGGGGVFWGGLLFFLVLDLINLLFVPHNHFYSQRDCSKDLDRALRSYNSADPSLTLDKNCTNRLFSSGEYLLGPKKKIIETFFSWV